MAQATWTSIMVGFMVSRAYGLITFSALLALHSLVISAVEVALFSKELFRSKPTEQPK